MQSDKNIIFPKKITEELLYTTVRITGLTNDKKESTGTGFFFNIELTDGRAIRLILTNKHVINDNTQLSFYLHEGVMLNNKLQPSGKFLPVLINDFKNFWIPHPNEAVDLGALLFSPLENQAKNAFNKSIFYKAFNKQLIKSDIELIESASVAEEVLMIGYPIGLWDEYNNFPIVRKGITATHPATNFQNKSIGVVDIACFPGSSGSPILLHSQGPHSQGNTISFGTKTILLGLLCAGPFYRSEGTIEIKEIPTQNTPVAINRQMIHLGYYVKAKEILNLSDHILLKYDSEINKNS